MKSRQVLVVDGFLPRSRPTNRCSSGARRSSSSACPIPADPAITRHVAAFLRRHAAARARRWPTPTRRAQHPTPPPPTAPPPAGSRHAAAEWRSFSCRCARRAPAARPSPVARRSAARAAQRRIPTSPSRAARSPYALVRQGTGGRIGGGSARSYFLVLEEQASRGAAICLLPRGSEEGHEIPLPERRFSAAPGPAGALPPRRRSTDTSYLAGRDRRRLAKTTSSACRRSPPVVQAPAGSSQRERAPCN
jgi:hypothetical protein